jgi:hypothetical protein
MRFELLWVWTRLSALFFMTIRYIDSGIFDQTHFLNAVQLDGFQNECGATVLQNELPPASAGGLAGEPPPEGSGNSFCAKLKHQDAEIHLINCHPSLDLRLGSGFSCHREPHSAGLPPARERDRHGRLRLPHRTSLSNSPNSSVLHAMHQTSTLRIRFLILLMGLAT